MKPETVKMLERAPLIVGVVTCWADARAFQADPNMVDLVEIRLDSIDDKRTIELAKSVGKPYIISARSQFEGGKQTSWSAIDRMIQYRAYMSGAAFIDIDYSGAVGLGSTIPEAQAENIGIILSYHFHGDTLPVPPHFKTISESAMMLGADVLKLEVQVNDFQDFAYFVEVTSDINKNLSKVGIRLSAMATGSKWGKLSRMVFGNDSTAMIYGHVGSSPVKGQWHVSEIPHMLKMMQD